MTPMESQLPFLSQERVRGQSNSCQRDQVTLSHYSTRSYDTFKRWLSDWGEAVSGILLCYIQNSKIQVLLGKRIKSFHILDKNKDLPLKYNWMLCKWLEPDNLNCKHLLRNKMNSLICISSDRFHEILQTELAIMKSRNAVNM